MSAPHTSHPAKPSRQPILASQIVHKLHRFGLHFREARRRAGLSQRDVYERTGLAQSYVSQVERGRANISLATMVYLAAAVGCVVTIEFHRSRADRTPSP